MRKFEGVVGRATFAVVIFSCLLLAIYLLAVQKVGQDDNRPLPEFESSAAPVPAGKNVVTSKYESLKLNSTDVGGAVRVGEGNMPRRLEAEGEPGQLSTEETRKAPAANQTESPPGEDDPAKLIQEAVQRVVDELGLDHEIQTSLKVRKQRVDRSAENRARRFTKRRQRGPADPITIYFKDGWGFWGHMGLDNRKYVDGCSVPCRATVDHSYLNTSEVVLLMEPSKTYKHIVRNEANNKRGVTAVAVLDPFFRQGWEPHLRSIDLLISFSRHSDVVTTYAYGSQLDENVNSTTLPKELLRRGVLLAGGEAALPRDWSDKIGDTAMFVSNCGSRWRTGYIQEIMKLTNVSSYGACFHTSGLNGGKREDKVPIVSKHKVFLSFENTLMEDYMTEKFFQAALIPAVTIYFGPTNANDYFPSPNPEKLPSIINGWDYRDPYEMARLIRRLTTDFEFWKSHLRWKATPEASRGDAAALSDGYKKLHDNNFVVTGPTSWICRTCEAYAKKYDFEGWEGDSEETTIVDDGVDEATYGISRPELGLR